MSNTKDYKKKCKQRVITFYPNEREMYELSKKINFQGFVKECLRKYTKEGC